MGILYHIWYQKVYKIIYTSSTNNRILMTKFQVRTRSWKLLILDCYSPTKKKTGKGEVATGRLYARHLRADICMAKSRFCCILLGWTFERQNKASPQHNPNSFTLSFTYLSILTWNCLSRKWLRLKCLATGRSELPIIKPAEQYALNTERVAYWRSQC